MAVIFQYKVIGINVIREMYQLPVIEVSFSTKSSTPWAKTLIAVEIWEMRLLSDVSKLTPLKNRKKCGTVLSEPNVDTRHSYVLNFSHNF